ncbi:sulfotransferase [Roseateles sp. DB2]|uniref:sulfotransferase n=1 Tax=Roseateles sp. DB2 TaxID=3453717 RepID=UPI003EEFEBF5
MLPLSQNLLKWLQQPAAQWQAMPLRTRARLRWSSHWNSLNLKLSRARLPATRVAEPAPWLILGCWRSGTTVMHELLAAATGLPTPETWQCMSACSFALLGAPPPSSPIARPMDGLEVGPRSPQEDEFALLSMGVDSAYRAFLAPARLPELTDTLEARHWLASNDWLDSLADFLALCRLSLSATGRPMLLKSPNHTFRLQALRRRWPQAKVVWMMRDAAAVFHSNRKMWRQMFDAHHLPGTDPVSDDVLDAFLAKAIHACADQLRWLLQQPDQDWSLCTHAELLAQPRQAVLRQLQMLEPGLAVDETQFRQALLRTGTGRVEQYHAAVPAVAHDAVLALQAAQEEAWRVQSARQQARGPMPPDVTQD